MGANVACCGRIRYLVRIVARIAVQGSRGSPLSCVIWHNGEIGDVTTWETPRGAPRTVPSSSGKRNTVLIATLTERPFFSFVEATSRFLEATRKLWRVSLPFGM